MKVKDGGLVSLTTPTPEIKQAIHISAVRDNVFWNFN